MCSHADLVRSCLQRTLALLQLDRDGAPRSVARELRVVAHRAADCGGGEVGQLARAAVAHADDWERGAGAEDARSAIFRCVMAIARCAETPLV